ncbi:MAG: hypothetical protein GC165_09450 [Armatimonadetes bacterium]|nr:hypothetical protein [Armatimonadota bacterium]
MKPREEMNLFKVTWQIIGVLVLIGGLDAIYLPTLFTHGYPATKSVCMSNLKQIGTGQLFYLSDYDDRLPPYYTFDSTESQHAFMDSLDPYLKKRQLFICPKVERDKGEGIQVNLFEGIPNTLDYVHCLSFKGQIPHFSDGNRVLDSKAVTSPSTVPWLRDSISTASKDAPKTTSGFASAHGNGFVVAYLDAHARYRTPIDPAREL